MSYAVIQQATTGLEAIGAIWQDGEATREGTLYRILFLGETKVCQRRRSEQTERSVIVETESKADFYNVRENCSKIMSATTTDATTATSS